MEAINPVLLREMQTRRKQSRISQPQFTREVTAVLGGVLWTGGISAVSCNP